MFKNLKKVILSITIILNFSLIRNLNVFAAGNPEIRSADIVVPSKFRKSLQHFIEEFPDKSKYFIIPVAIEDDFKREFVLNFFTYKFNEDENLKSLVLNLQKSGELDFSTMLDCSKNVLERYKDFVFNKGFAIYAHPKSEVEPTTLKKTFKFMDLNTFKNIFKYNEFLNLINEFIAKIDKKDIENFIEKEKKEFEEILNQIKSTPGSHSRSGW